jgi:hypothetical protein
MSIRETIMLEVSPEVAEVYRCASQQEKQWLGALVSLFSINIFRSTDKPG